MFNPTTNTLGIIAAVSLLFSAFALLQTWQESKRGRIVDEALLFAIALERINIAREIDSNLKATKRKEPRRVDKPIWECENPRGKKQLTARLGQVAILERMVNLGIDLRNIVLSDVNLVAYQNHRENKAKAYGINLENAKLSYANLRNTNLERAYFRDAVLNHAILRGSCLLRANLVDSHLSNASLVKSNLSRADLSSANLTDADLYQANFSFATLAGVKLMNADVTGANFNRAKGLTQRQLDTACSEPDKQPINLPKPLEWTPKECR